MNMVRENTNKSIPQNHLSKSNITAKTPDIKEFNVRNFENQKVKINQKKENNSINLVMESSQKYNQLNYKLQEEKIHTLSNINIIFDINGKDILENDDRNGQSLFYNEKDIQEDKELLDLFLINRDVENKNKCQVTEQKNSPTYQPNTSASPSNINNNLKQQRNIFNFKKMDIEMIPEEDEERLKTEYETGRKFYDNQQEKKQESLTDKLKENQVRKKLIINNNTIKKNLESVITNFQKGESENTQINFIKMNEFDDKNRESISNYHINRNMKLNIFVKSKTPKGDINKIDFSTQSGAPKINYNDILSIDNLNGILNLYPYNYTINLNPTANSEKKEISRCEFLKKSNSELFEKDNENIVKSFSKYDRQTLINKDNEKINKKINLHHSKSVNFDNNEVNLKLDLGRNINKPCYLKEKEGNKNLNIVDNKTNSQLDKILDDNKNISINNKLGKANNVVNNESNNNKNNNSSYPDIIKFENNDKIDFENSFDQISEISIKNNSTLNTNYNMSPDKEKTLNESIAINQNSKDKIVDNHLNQENNDLKSLIDFINKKQFQNTKSLGIMRLKEENKINISKNSSINIYNQNNTNNSNSAYSKNSKKNGIINSKNIDSVDTDVSILNQQYDSNNKSKLSIKQMKAPNNKDNNHLNILKISKIKINDEVPNKEQNILNKLNTISKNSNSNSSQNEILNACANNISINNNEKSLSSIYQRKTRFKSHMSSPNRINIIDREKNNSFNSNIDYFGLNINDKEKSNNQINESQDVLNNNFDFNQLQNEEQENKRSKFMKFKGKMSENDLNLIKFPSFKSESTKNKNNYSSLFNGNLNFDKTNKDMKLPLINYSLNKSLNVNNIDLAESKNSVNNTRINNQNNSILKDKSFLRNMKNNSSLISNKFDVNVYPKNEEEICDPLEKEKFASFRSKNLKDLKSKLNDFSSQINQERNKITSGCEQINENSIKERNLTLEREIHSNEGKTKYVNNIKNKANISNNNNIVESIKILTNNKVSFISNSNINNKNGFIFKKNYDNDKKSQPIKLFNMNLNKVNDK